MRDCRFALNTKGLYQCTRKGCGWVYPLKADKAPHRNCDVSEGLGDTIAWLIKRFLRIAGCGGCRKRQAWLNRLLPYRDR